MFQLSGVNYEELLEQGDSILVRVIASSSYRGFELSGLYCIYICSSYICPFGVENSLVVVNKLLLFPLFIKPILECI